MSKSLEYIKSLVDLEDEFIKEIPSEEYFDEFLCGKRERLQKFKDGFIKIKLIFDENADFNWERHWDGIRYEWEDDLDETIEDFVLETLKARPRVPLQEDGQILGGNNEPGDLVEFTFGNFIVYDKITMNKGIEEKRAIFIPYKYERKAGKMNE